VRRTFNTAATPLGIINYDPWGTPKSGTVPTFGFTGELQDATTGLVNLRARWYSTTQGKFTTVDPYAGDPARPYSLHQYQYGFSDPVLMTDPSGRDPWWKEANQDRDCIPNLEIEVIEGDGHSRCEPFVWPQTLFDPTAFQSSPRTRYPSVYVYIDGRITCIALNSDDEQPQQLSFWDDDENKESAGNPPPARGGSPPKRRKPKDSTRFEEVLAPLPPAEQPVFPDDEYAAAESKREFGELRALTYFESEWNYLGGQHGRQGVDAFYEAKGGGGKYLWTEVKFRTQGSPRWLDDIASREGTLRRMSRVLGPDKLEEIERSGWRRIRVVVRPDGRVLIKEIAPIPGLPPLSGSG